jgi:hypothetical protein
MKMEQRLFLDGVDSHRRGQAIIEVIKDTFDVAVHSANTGFLGLYRAAPLADVASDYGAGKFFGKQCFVHTTILSSFLPQL